MNKFWPSVALTLVGVAVGIVLLPGLSRFQRSVAPSLDIVPRLWFIFLLSVLVAVVWAICFRRQVEQLQISMKAILILIVMESMLLTACRFLHGF